MIYCLGLVLEQGLVLASDSRTKAETTLILGGQNAGEPHGLYLIYPQGNYFAASPETPYLQIGETSTANLRWTALRPPNSAWTMGPDCARCRSTPLPARTSPSARPSKWLSTPRTD